MGKKRANTSKKASQKHQMDNPTMKRWNTYDDIERDSEDEFHHQRDVIGFDESNDQFNSDDDIDNEEEVYGLNGMQDSSEEDDSDEEDADEDDVDENVDEEDVDENDYNVQQPQEIEQEDEENDDDVDDHKLKSWGSKQGAYYAREDENLSSDEEDEEDRKLEENEALKLQKSSRQDWKWDDITGVTDPNDLNNMDEIEDLKMDEDEDKDQRKKSATTPTIDLSNLSKDEKLAYIQKTSPETLALITDYEDVLDKVNETEKSIKMRKSEDEQHPGLGLLYTYHQTLLTYAPLLTFYLYLRASPQLAHDRDHLLKHPVLKRLLTLKEGLSRMEELGFGPGAQEETEENDEEREDVNNMIKLWAQNKENANEDVDDSWKAMPLEDGELDGLLGDESQPVNVETGEKKKKKKSKKSKKNENDKPSVVHELDESQLEYTPSSTITSKKSKINEGDDDALREADSLSTIDANSKKSNKKSLQFHTTRIAQAQNRRSGAAKTRAGGDDDVPYRERKKQKLEKLTPSAQGDELDSSEWTEHDEQARREIMDEGNNDDETNETGNSYYDLVSRSKKDAKAKKKEDYDEMKWKSRVDYVDETGVDGPRTLPRDIALNKAITPARSFKHSKLNRNPRLKKRIRYDQAQKKLKSMKPTYQGGLEGEYQGEKSGITTNVKSTKF